MADPNLQFVRCKREKKIFFYRCRETDRVEALRDRVAEFLNVESDGIRLYLGDRLLDENSTIHDQDMKNDSMIKILLKKKVMGEDVWETMEEWENVTYPQNKQEQQPTK